MEACERGAPDAATALTRYEKNDGCGRTEMLCQSKCCVEMPRIGSDDQRSSLRGGGSTGQTTRATSFLVGGPFSSGRPHGILVFENALQWCVGLA